MVRAGKEKLRESMHCTQLHSEKFEDFTHQNQKKTDKINAFPSFNVLILWYSLTINQYILNTGYSTLLSDVSTLSRRLCHAPMCSSQNLCHPVRCWCITAPDFSQHEGIRCRHLRGLSEPVNRLQGLRG